jgi:hypothetical protein
MAISQKTVPYEVLIRFNWEPEFGALGIYRGAHYIEATVLTDDATGEVLSYKPGDAQPLPQDGIVSYLGTQFVQINLTVTGLQAQLETAQADLATAQQKITELEQAAQATT